MCLDLHLNGTFLTPIRTTDKQVYVLDDVVTMMVSNRY